MPKLYLVRHGEAAAGWTEDPDPGLSIRGREQARDLADALVAVLPPMPVLTSPLRRTRETAEAIASRWGIAIEVTPSIGEVPTPEGIPIEERGSWLRGFMEGRWADSSEPLRAWRDEVIQTFAGLPHDALLVSHYVAINAAVAEADGDDRVVVFRPGNCSVTVIDRDGIGLAVLERGAQAHTLVL